MFVLSNHENTVI